MPYKPSEAGVESKAPRLIGKFIIYNGAVLMITALGVGILGAIVMGMLDRGLQDAPEHGEKMPPFVMDMIELRPYLLPLTLPAAIAGLALMLGSRHVPRPVAWLLLAAGYLWAIIIFACLLYAFILFLSPAYRYEPL